MNDYKWNINECKNVFIVNLQNNICLPSYVVNPG